MREKGQWEEKGEEHRERSSMSEKIERERADFCGEKKEKKKPLTK